jgi:hypothetical protein
MPEAVAAEALAGKDAADGSKEIRISVSICGGCCRQHIAGTLPFHAMRFVHGNGSRRLGSAHSWHEDSSCKELLLCMQPEQLSQSDSNGVTSRRFVMHLQALYAG